MILVKKDELSDIFLAPDCFVINGKAYKATPSAVATHKMLTDYLNGTGLCK